MVNVLVTNRPVKTSVKFKHRRVQGQPFLDSVGCSTAHDAVGNTGILESTARSSARGARWSEGAADTRHVARAGQSRDRGFSLFGGTGRKVTLRLECGSAVKLVKERSRYRGDVWN